MHVMKKYIDTRNAAVAVLEEFPAMKQILCPLLGSPLDQEPMDLLVSSSADIAPELLKFGNVSGKNDLMVTDNYLDFYGARNSQARQYMEWFSSAWSVLSPDDQRVLATFFLAQGTQEDLVNALAQRYFIERDSVYRRKNRALKKFATALFG